MFNNNYPKGKILEVHETREKYNWILSPNGFG